MVNDDGFSSEYAARNTKPKTMHITFNHDSIPNVIHSFQAICVDGRIITIPPLRESKDMLKSDWCYCGFIACSERSDTMETAYSMVGTAKRFFGGYIHVMTATAGSDVVQSRRPIFDDFFQHLWPYIGNNTANVVFQMIKRLWLIRIDQ
ncbi:hypothetical protein TNCV_4362581 [Trichonephila clavipes]|nr:hypothetical protein TNCV_4362581 [Trichonephila clavipes]